MLSAIKALILVLIIGVVIYKISFIEAREYTTNFSQFVSLRGVDEYVVNELRTNENFHRVSEKYYGTIFRSVEQLLTFR